MAPRSAAPAPTTRPDLAAALVLALLVPASRLPLAGEYLTTWDAVQYALALEHFDVALHQPHPPGYILYVGLLRGANLILGEARLSILTVNTLFGALAVGLTYLVGVRLFGRLTGLVAALLLLTSPTMWYCGATYEPYAVLAGLSALVAYLCWRALQGEHHLLTAATAALAASGGVRPDAALFLGPLWLVSLVQVLGQRRERLRFAAGQVLLLVAVSLAWYLPLLSLTGGWHAYTQLCQAQLGWCLHSKSALFGVPWTEHAVMAAHHAASAALAVGPVGALLFLAALPLLAAGDKGAPVARPFLVVWALPAFAFYTLIFFSKPGYSLTYAPALALLAGRGFDLLEAKARDILPDRAASALGALLLSATLAASGLLFLAGPSPTPAQAAGKVGAARRLLVVARGEAASVTLSAIREEDRRLKVYLTALRERFSPEAAAVVCRAGSPDWRRLMYYLRDRDVFWLVDERLMRRTPNGSEFWLARGGRVTLSSSGAGFWLPGKGFERLSVPLAPERRELVVIATEGDPLLTSLVGRAQRIELPGGHHLLRLPLEGRELSCGRFVFTRAINPAPEAPPLVVPAAAEATVSPKPRQAARAASLKPRMSLPSGPRWHNLPARLFDMPTGPLSQWK